MGYDDGFDNDRDELYHRFLQSLKEPANERFFDEDELVEIFDYAGDLGDDYARSEVLFCGARLYPDSLQLQERRALLYLDLEDAEKDIREGSAAAYMTDNPGYSSLLFDIVKLETDRPQNGPAALAFLMDAYQQFSDEEAIRFAQLAFDLDAYDWLKANLVNLRKKVSYLPSLLYEIMQEADSRCDDETTISLAEELIELEPFSVAYWSTLFRAQARAGKEEDARQTFDTTRALSSDNKAGLMSLADAVYSYAPYLASEAAEMLLLLREENPEEFAYTDCRCAILSQSGNIELAVKELREFVEAHPGDFRSYKQLLLCNVPDARQITERFLEYADPLPGDDDIDDLVNTLHLRSNLRSLNGLFEVLFDRGMLTVPNQSAWIECLFAFGKYEDVVRLFESIDDKTLLIGQPVKGPATAYEYLVSLMKLGEECKAQDFIESVRPLYETIMAESPIPVRMGIRCFFSLVDKIQKHPASDKLYWDYFDMLSISKF